MLLADVVAVSASVARTKSRSEKTTLLAELLRRVRPEEAELAASYLSGSPLQRKLGIGYAGVFSLEVAPSIEPNLQLTDVHEALEAIAVAAGPGSKSLKSELLADLMSRATSSEQDFLRGLVLRNLRQGALEGVMAEAIAEVLDVDAERVRRAAMLEGDLVIVAGRALSEGAEALGEAALAVFTPIQPMLAKSASSAGSALETLGEALVEQKLDGLRLQVHRRDDEVVIFTRNLRDISGEMPAVTEAVLSYDARQLILDGEGLMVRADGTPYAFQDSMSRPETGQRLLPFFFDILHLDGADLIDLPLSQRREALSRVVPETHRARAVVTAEPVIADEFFEETVASGFEGVVVKDLTQSYEAGRRGSGWLKVKPTHTLDLVILAAEWGSGRRRGWLSNLHLGARDGDGGYVMLGKTFKGLTDQMLEWQTGEFLAVEERRSGNVVYLKPRIVYEIAFDGVQRSTRYPGGVALRFARVKGYRPDKSPEDADTLEAVRFHLR